MSSNAQKIKKCITDIGKAELEFSNNISINTYNGIQPRATPNDYYTQLHHKFNQLLLIQLKENCPKGLLEKYIELTKGEIQKLKIKGEYIIETYSLLKFKDINSEIAKESYNDIKAILSTQYSVLLKILSKLEEELEFYDFKTSADYQTESDVSGLSTSNIPFSDSGKVTFKMSKKESLMFLYVLEQESLIEFDDDNHRRKFIENNFNFTEVRQTENEGKPFPMIGVSSEISKFKSRVDAKSNNKTLEILLNKLNNTIHQFEFKE